MDLPLPDGRGSEYTARAQRLIVKKSSSTESAFRKVADVFHVSYFHFWRRDPMCYDRFAMSGKSLAIVWMVLVLSGVGCEKVPTFQELTQQAQPTPAPANATPVEPTKAAAVQQPVAAVKAAPPIEDSQKVISDFKNKASAARNDQDLARICSLPDDADAESVRTRRDEHVVRLKDH